MDTLRRPCPALLDHVGPKVVDYVIVNDAAVEPHLLRKYEAEGAIPVYPDVNRIRAMGIEPIARPLISLTDLVRHDPTALAKCISDIALPGEQFQGPLIPSRCLFKPLPQPLHPAGKYSWDAAEEREAGTSGLPVPGWTWPPRRPWKNHWPSAQFDGPA